MVELLTSICQLPAVRAARRGRGGLRGRAVAEGSLACAWPWVPSPAPKPKTNQRSWEMYLLVGEGLENQGWVVTATLNDTLIFGLLFSTEKPRGVGGHSSTLDSEAPSGLDLERCRAWYSTEPIRKPLRSALPQSRMNGPGNVCCQRGVAFFEPLKLAFWICWIK